MGSSLLSIAAGGPGDSMLSSDSFELAQDVCIDSC